MRKSPKHRSVMVHDFSTIAAANIPRSTFSLNHSYKTTIQEAGRMYPILVQEVLPGDTHRLRAQVFARLATPIKPIMDNITAEVFFFFCANRVSWPNFVKFMGQQDQPGDSTDYTIPRMVNGTVTSYSLGDYFGLPLGLDYDLTIVNALPFRAWNRIHDDWFRKQDLVGAYAITTHDGPDPSVNYTLWRRMKRPDYFTSALPWPQFGPGASLPLGVEAPVFVQNNNRGDLTNQRIYVEDGDIPGNARGLAEAGDGLVDWSASGVWAEPTDLWTDLSNATASTINDLRQAFQIQKLMERDARGGHRYQEIVMSHFGVRGSDHRHNRSEYLGGGRFNVGITQVPQTGATVIDGTGSSGAVAETAQGNLAAYGTTLGSAGFTKSFSEHGYIIGMIHFGADLTYQKGLDRHWSRQTKYDLYWPALAKLGEMPILNKEIYVTNDATDDEVWGYQERWSELRHTNSKITGAFRSDHPTSLDVWHLSQDFATRPALNATFMEDDPPVERVIAVQTEPHFLCDIYYQHKATRPMPVDGSPGYIDHF